jgi:hypothetical protein
MATKAKATFSIRRDLLEAIDSAVSRGAAPSKNVFVEQAIQREVHEFRRRALAIDWAEATKDPLFMRDIQEVEAAFSITDAEADGLLR